MKPAANAANRKKSRLKKDMLKDSLESHKLETFIVPDVPVQTLLHTSDGEQTVDIINDASEFSDMSSDSEDEDGNDTLTPEVAFHLPPGSLSSFSPPVDDDVDPLSSMRNRNCDLDGDDDEIIRCSNNFSFESTAQLSRDLSSPTLNQLSSSDFDSSFNLFMSPTKSVGISSVVNPMTASFLSSFSGGTAENLQDTSKNKSKQTPIGHSKDADAHRAVATSLKISPLNTTYRKIKFSSSYTPKHFSGGRNNTFTENNVHNAERTKSTNSLSNGHHESSSITPYSFTNGRARSYYNLSPQHHVLNDDNTLSKRYLNDSFLLQQPLSQDASLFDDISTEVDSPLEKVNPDIFFSSAFPISTSTANL